MDLDLLKRLNEERRTRRAVMLVTDVGEGHAHVLTEGDSPPTGLSEAVETAFRSGKSGLVEAGRRRYFLNVHVPPPKLVIIGAVHISQALAPMAAMTGFDVTVIDPRTAFATPERFTGTRLLAEWPEEVLAREPLDPFAALAAITHDPKIDDYPLQAALQAGCFYVGALGSRKTHGRRVERLSAAGLTEKEIGRIAAPIGLDIGAANPQEIAVAVLAQTIAALRKRELARQPDRLVDA